MKHLYIYYRVRPEFTDQAHALILEIHARVQERTGIRARLLQKIDSTDEAQQTWMEVYENVTSDFETVLDEMIRNAQFFRFVEAGRHVERFVEYPLESCA